MQYSTRTKQQQENLEPIITELGHDIDFIEQPSSASFIGVKGIYSHPRWPSPISLMQSAEFKMYRLAADWELPEKLGGNWTSLRDAHQSVVDAMSKHSDAFVGKDMADYEELFPTKKKDQSSLTLIAEDIVGESYLGFDITESLADGVRLVRINSTRLPAEVVLQKPKSDLSYTLSCVGELPEGMIGSRFTEWKLAVEALDGAVDA